MQTREFHLSPILVVDDHPIIAEACRVVLGDVEDVVAARDVPSGYQAFLEHRPGVVILDLTFPGEALGGVDLLHRISSDAPLARVLVFSMIGVTVFGLFLTPVFYVLLRTITGMSEYDASMIFMPIAEAQAYFNRNKDVTAIEIFTTDPGRIDQFRKEVMEVAGRPVLLVDWRQRNSTFFNALQVERNVMFLILIMSSCIKATSEV